MYVVIVGVSYGMTIPYTRRQMIDAYEVVKYLRDFHCDLEQFDSYDEVLEDIDAMTDDAEETVSGHPWLKGRLAGSCLA